MMESGDGAGGRRPFEVPIVRLTDAAVARSLARRLASDRGWARLVASSIGIVASELATNAVRHGGGGVMEIHASASRFEVRCADRGHGDPAVLRRRAHEPPPQFAPGEGLGQGLAAATRLSHSLDISARDGGGIVVSASWIAKACTRRVG